MLGRIRLGVGAMFGAAALLTRGRATHRRGVGAAGELRIVARPTFPEHELFAAGRVFQVRLRHANLEADDDAAMDIRGASLKLSDQDEDAPLDLVMNTGEASLFRDAWVFLDFVRARPRGAEGFRWMAERWPREWQAGAAGWRLGPSSYARLRYHSQIVTRFRGTDGVVRMVRYRLLPGDRGPEDGIPDPGRLVHPISLERRDDDGRPQDCLRRELVERLADGPVRYWLQAQLHLPRVTDPAEIADSSRTWDEAGHPWHDLGEIVLTRALAPTETEALRFNVGRQPESLGLFDPAGPDDYHSIGWLRTRVYPVSQLARTLRRSREPEVRAAPPALPSDELVEQYRRLDAHARAEVSAVVLARAAGLRAAEGRAVADGRLVHDDPQDGPTGVPVHGVTVELWDRDRVGRDDFLGRAETDADGRFEIRYDPADAGAGDDPDLELRVLDEGRVVQVVAGDDDVRVDRYDFGTLAVRCWEYLPGPLARLYVPPGEDPPQDFSPGRRPSLLRNLARSASIRARHALACRSDAQALTLDQVQEDYPPTPPVHLDRQRPGTTRSDAYFVDRLLNGFYPAPLVAVGPDRFEVAYAFDRDELNGRYDLPNVACSLVRRDGALVPEWIRVVPRLGIAPGSGLGEPVVVRPDGGERWTCAKRIFTSTHIVAGEVDGHLCRAHLDVEQYALAAFRNLRRSPLRALLAPHLKEVTTINWQGQAWVYGESGIVPKISGLTPRAVGQRFVDQMGRVDWCGYGPPEPLGPDHRWAHVAALYWELLGEHVEETLHRERDAIRASWDEVVAFSGDLARRSAPLTGSPDEAAPPLALARVEAGGAVRAVRPVASGPTPTDDDWSRLRDVCRYAIFRATLWHSWINDKQLEDGGDVRIGTLGRRNGGFGDDRRCGALPTDASEQLWLVGVLVGTAWGYVLRNEDGDVPIGLVERLRARREAFARHGYDVEQIRSRVNI